VAKRGGSLPEFADLEVIRLEADISVRRFCARIGVPTSTWYYWRAAHLEGRVPKRWPAPVVDQVEAAAAEQAHRWSAWGHRKIWGMLRADGIMVSRSSVYRALKRQDLLLPARYQAARRQLAQERKKAFVNPPARRNRVWQTDFTRMEITSGSAWWIAPVTDYYAKVVLAAPISTRTAAADAIMALRAAIDNAEKILGHPLLEDCVNRETGELEPLIIVTDNGPCYKSTAFARFIASRVELQHVRTRHHAPETNGVVERFNQSLKYEHLYRYEIANGQELIEHVEHYLDVFNRIRPHETLDQTAPMKTYLLPPA
jgi:putative transposase